MEQHKLKKTVFPILLPFREIELTGIRKPKSYSNGKGDFSCSGDITGRHIQKVIFIYLAMDMILQLLILLGKMNLSLFRQLILNPPPLVYHSIITASDIS